MSEYPNKYVDAEGVRYLWRRTNETFATKEELETVQSSVAKVYKYKGQVQTAEDLNDIQNPENGDTYDVLEDGTNYTWNEDESRWDNLGSIIKMESLSNYDLDIITGSASTEAALKAMMADGGTVELGQNITVTDSITVTENTILNLNKHTLSFVGVEYGFVIDDSSLTICNGSITAPVHIADVNGELIIEDGNYTSGEECFIGSDVTVHGGVFSPPLN